MPANPPAISRSRHKWSAGICVALAVLDEKFFGLVVLLPDEGSFDSVRLRLSPLRKTVLVALRNNCTSSTKLGFRVSLGGAGFSHQN